MREKWLRKYTPLLLGAACVLLSGCAKPDRTIADIQKDGRVKVAVAVNKEQPEKQRYLSAEEQRLIDRICESLSVTAEYAFYEPQALERALADGKGDLGIGALRKSEWKDRQDIWNSEEYEQRFLFTVTLRGDYLSSVKALSEQNVGISGHIGEVEKQQLYLADDITLVTYDGAENVEQDLKKNIISAYVCYQNEAEKLAQARDLQIQDLANIMPEGRSVLVKAGNDELLTEINRLIQEIKQE